MVIGLRLFDWIIIMIKMWLGENEDVIIKVDVYVILYILRLFFEF